MLESRVHLRVFCTAFNARTRTHATFARRGFLPCNVHTDTHTYAQFHTHPHTLTSTHKHTHRAPVIPIVLKRLNTRGKGEICCTVYGHGFMYGVRS